MKATSRYSDKAILMDIVKSSFTVGECLQKLGINRIGGNTYREFYRFIKIYSIDISHFTGIRTKGRSSVRKRPLAVYLSNQFKIGSHRLKERLLAEKILDNSCSKCQLRDWMGKPIPLQLDHIDGNPNNNQLENLRILCPNCHAQTPNFCGKNTKKRKTDKKPSFKKGICISCSIPCSSKGGKCRACQDKSLIKFGVSKDSLEEMLKTYSVADIALQFSVAESTVWRRCKKLLISF